MKKDRGFTLVELVVVIAILGVLAGVAVPVYSGYVKKAHQAADNQLLGAVNTAFAAACLENGTSNTAFADNSVNLSVSSKKITGISGTGITDSIGDDFEKYFGTNQDTELQYYVSSGDFEFKGGSFYGKGTSAAKSMTLSIGGKDYTLSWSNADAETIAVSSVKTAGGEALTQKMDLITDKFAKYLGTDANGIAGIFQMMGMDADDQATFISTLMTEIGVTDASATDDAKVNAAVKYVAGSIAGLNAETVASEISTKGFTGWLTTGLPFNNGKLDLASMSQDQIGEFFTKSALSYAMLTTYAYSGEATEAQENKIKGSNVTAALTVADEAEFRSYLATDQGKKDFAGVIASMNVINSNNSVLDSLETADFGAFASVIDQILAG